MGELAAVALGGAIGASLRYGVSQLLGPRIPGEFPWHTFIVNITGAFLLGLVMGVVLDRHGIGHYGRLFLGVGVLGGYTTFSTLAFETVDLFWEGAGLIALANSIGTIVIGVLAAALGLAIARAF